MLYQLSYAHHIALLAVAEPPMARPAGLEPATIRLEGGCSIQLSYGRLFGSCPRRDFFGVKPQALPFVSDLGCARQAGRML